MHGTQEGNGEEGAEAVAAVNLADIERPEKVNVVDALESFAAEALRSVEFARRRMEAVKADDPIRLQYETVYNAAMDRAAKMTTEFAKVGSDKYRAAERVLLAELVAELVVLLISRFVSPSRRKEADEWARVRLSQLASGDLGTRVAS